MQYIMKIDGGMDVNQNDYLTIVLKRFPKVENIQLDSLVVKSIYEERFEIEWLATKLKVFSFITYMSKIDFDDIRNYSVACMDYALKNYKGLPRGLQNGVVAFNVLVSENVSEQAIAFANKRPKKHFSAFEMPIIFDLSKEQIFFYRDTPLWGKIYYEYFREYIEKSFNV